VSGPLLVAIVEHLRTKLGVSGRAEIAAWVAGLG
jgi:hypothetical protein